MKINGEIRVFNKPLTMGILNLTDDSFYAGSRVSGESGILLKAKQMLEEGADILDLGAYSTRPGADDVSVAQETERLIGGIKAIKDKFPDAILSADTFRAGIAERQSKRDRLLLTMWEAEFSPLKCLTLWPNSASRMC